MRRREYERGVYLRVRGLGFRHRVVDRPPFYLRSPFPGRYSGYQVPAVVDDTPGVDPAALARHALYYEFCVLPDENAHIASSSSRFSSFTASSVVPFLTSGMPAFSSRLQPSSGL